MSSNTLVFQVIEREGPREYQGYRAVRLLQLRYISMEARRDAGLLQKMRTVLRGLYGAQVDLVYLAAGVFQNPKIGIVQCYGVAAFSPKKEEAIQRSLRDLSALRAGLVGAYRQMRLEPLSTEVAQWLARSLEQMPYAIVAVGHPDPRENARGGDSSMRDPLMSGSQGAQQYSIQQNELLFRGMSSLEEEFLLMLLTSHVRLEDITRMLSGMLEDTAVYASRQLGTRAASFGISLPAFLTGGLAENASQSYGTNHSSGVTQGVSATDGTAASQGQAHTVGQASTSGWAHTVGVSETDTVGSSSTVGTAITQGTAHTEGTGVTDGSSHTDSSGAATSHIDSSAYGVSGGVGEVLRRQALGYRPTWAAMPVGARRTVCPTAVGWQTPACTRCHPANRIPCLRALLKASRIPHLKAIRTPNRKPGRPQALRPIRWQIPTALLPPKVTPTQKAQPTPLRMGLAWDKVSGVGSALE